MVRLAIIGSPDEQHAWQAVSTRLPQACFVACAPDEPRSGSVLINGTEGWLRADDAEHLFTKHADAYDAVILHGAVDCKGPRCRQALALGKHVLAMAPLAPDRAAWDDLVAQCHDGSHCFQVGRPWRHVRSVQAVKNSLTQGKLGEPGLLRLHSWRPAGRAGTDLDRLVPGIDLALWMFDGLPKTVFALEREPLPDSQGGYLQLHLGFPGNGMAVIDLADTLPPGADYESLSVIGSAGAAYADDHHNMNLLYAGDAPAALRTGQGQGHWASMLQEFVDAIHGDVRNDPDGERSDVMQVVEAVRQSIKANAVVHQQADHYAVP